MVCQRQKDVVVIITVCLRSLLHHCNYVALMLLRMVLKCQRNIITMTREYGHEYAGGISDDLCGHNYNGVVIFTIIQRYN